MSLMWFGQSPKANKKKAKNQIRHPMQSMDLICACTQFELDVVCMMTTNFSEMGLARLDK